MNTKYYIDYITLKETSGLVAYYQLVRAKDDAILYSNWSLDNIFLHCWHNDIRRDEVTIL